MSSNIIRTVFYLAILSIPLFFASCDVEDSADVNQDKIYTTYEVFYNKNSDKTLVVARFRFGGPTGTLLELKDDASVTYNGDDLVFNTLVYGHYKEYAGQLTGGDFFYTNTDLDTFRNSVPAYDTIAFPPSLDTFAVLPDTISKSAAFDLAWHGTALAANQRMGIFVGSWAWGQDALFVQNTVGATNIVLAQNKLGTLALGGSVFYMDRTTDVPVAEGTSEGGKIRGTFRCINRQVVIVE